MQRAALLCAAMRPKEEGAGLEQNRHGHLRIYTAP